MSIVRMTQLATPLIVMPYLIRTVGIDNYGVISYSLSISLFFMPIIQYGFNVTAARDISNCQEHKVLIREISCAVFFASLFLALISAILFLIILTFQGSGNGSYFLHTSSFILIAFQSLIPTWYFLGTEKMKYIAFFSLLSNLLFVIALFCMVRVEGDYLYVNFIHAAATLISLLLSLVYIYNDLDGRIVVPNLSSIKKQLKHSFDGFLTQFSPNLYNNLSSFLIGFFVGSSELGVYSAVQKIINALIAIGNLVSSAFLPYLAKNRTRHPLYRNLIMFFALIILLVGIFFNNIIIDLFISTPGNTANDVFVLLLLSLPFTYMYMVYNTNYLMIYGLQREASAVAVYTSIVFSVVAIILTYKYGLFGAVITILLSRVVMSTSSLYLSLRKSNV